MAKKKTRKDPHSTREANKYDNPIPSREFIMETLEEALMTHSELAHILGLRDDDSQFALKKRLRAMERDGQLARNRKKQYGLISKMSLTQGRVIAHADGFGFVVPADGTPDIFLSPREMARTFHDDTVLVRVTGFDRRGKPEGAVVEVVEHHCTQLVGALSEDGGVFSVAPHSKHIRQDILIKNSDLGKAEPGDIVEVEVTRYPGGGHRYAFGKVTEVLGQKLTPAVAIDMAIRNHDLPMEWPSALTDELSQISTSIELTKGRRDLRNVKFVTIDGDDSKDFDDAVACEPLSNGHWLLRVGIADVSHYVQAGTELDAAARERGNSVYFPGRVIPMLPELLSNDLCSLVPKQDRYALVCEMTISEKGELQQYEFYSALIHSHARLTYNQVADFFEEKNVSEDCVKRSRELKHLFSVYQALSNAREMRGAIDLDIPEASVSYQGDEVVVKPLVRTVAHRIIEECMVTANVAAAKFLESHKMHFPYRVHAPPESEKLLDLNKFLHCRGLSLPIDKIQTMDYANLLKSARGREDIRVIQTMLLRSFSQAVYSEDNLGHFGLSLTDYAHFTSPIRRYPDLLVHRAIKFVCDKVGEPYLKPVIHSHSVHCSVTERRADEASWDVLATLKCMYMEDKVGKTYQGVITTVTHFGCFVELTDVLVEGLIHITALGADYFQFDPAEQSLTGTRSKTVYQVGDPIEVKVSRVLLEEKKIDLEVAGVTQSKNKKGRRK